MLANLNPRHSKPRFSWKGLAIAAAIWLLYTLFYAFLLKVWGDLPLTAMLMEGLKQNTILALYSLPGWFLIIQGMDGRSWWLIIAVHLIVGGPIYAFAVDETYLFVSTRIVATSPEFVSDFERYRVWYFLSHMTVYFLQFAVFHGVRSLQRLREQERRAGMLSILARDREMAALKSQINPHFLFNTLNSISASVPVELEKTRVLIQQLGSLLRYTLDSANHDLVPLKDEIRFIKSYLTLEQERFGERLEFTIESSREALKTRVPPMILQPLIENAVVHGIAPKVDGGKITLVASIKNGSLLVSISDDGLGLDGETLTTIRSRGMGLKNTDMRLRARFGEHCGLQVTSGNEGGVEVSFTLPIMHSV